MTTLEKLLNGSVSCLPEGGLQKKLASDKKLIIKLGMDPTAPDLHLGHAVVLRKMRDFQNAGHVIVFLIGDCTARIGDPSGKSKTRPPLSQEDIEKNTQTYFQQVTRILDKDKVIIRYNSEWLDKLTFSDVLKLGAQVTLARIIEREDFAKRLSLNVPIGFHELMYPIMQGYDSVALKADVELGGTDQTFNLLMGRFLQEQYKQDAQVIMTMPLLEGLDGVEKMSKSLGNYVGLAETAEQAFGKLMSISDALMWRYYKLLLGYSDAKIQELKEGVYNSIIHPMALKKDMAQGIVAEFWSSKEAEDAKKTFEDVFQKKDLSKAQTIHLPIGTSETLWIVDFLKILGAISSSSEAKRLIENGSVSLDSHIISDFKYEVTWRSGMTIKVGKHRVYVIG